MSIPNQSTRAQLAFGDFCDWGIVYSLSALIFVLPVSIALLDSFAALAITLYFLKKINRIVIDWPLNSFNLNLLGKINLIWKSLAPPLNILDRPLQILSLAVFISVIFSQYPALSFFAFIGKFLKVVFLYFSFIEAFSDEKRLRIFLYSLCAAAFITALNGAFQHFAGRDFIKGRPIGTENLISTRRISSTFFGANGFGAYLLPVIGLVAHLLFTAIVRHRSWLGKAVLTLFLALLLICLCWTYSRSSWIGYLTFVFVMCLLDRRKVIFAGALILVFILLFLPSLNNVRHLSLLNDHGIVLNENYSFDLWSFLEQGGGSGRHAFWKKAVSIIRSSPVCGTGLNTYSRIVKRDPNPQERWYAHNSYLQMAAETGLVGLVCFLWLLFVLLRHSINYCKLDTHDHLWQLTILQGTVSGLFGYLVQSFFDNTFYSVQLCVLLWVIIGLMVAVTRLNWKGALNG